MKRLPQRERLKQLFQKNRGVWVNLPVILRMYISQYGRVLGELRHQEGMIIWNEVYFEKGIRKSKFMYVGDQYET